MPNTLLTLLDSWAIERGNHLAYIFLNSQGQEAETITFKQLQDKSVQFAMALAARNLERERIVLALPPGLDFIISFIGCLYAKSIAVPLPPPRSKRQLARSRPVIEDAMPALIITDQNLENDFLIPTLSVKELLDSFITKDRVLPEVLENDIAFLQYTSGSTSLPKGVILTHFHLIHHQKVIQKAFRHNQETKIVGWLPFYHDMGLIGNILHALYLGVTSVLMAPMTFIQHPILWLEAISRYHATTSGGPDFAYQHCISKITDHQLENLDLKSWKIAFNGAERIQLDTLKSFSNRFSKAGFCATAFYPCYGLAEATLFVTGRQDVISMPFKTPEGQISEVVSCGQPAQGESVIIVDPVSKQPCSEGKQGEVWVQGPSVAAGYWNKDDESKQTFAAYTVTEQGPFLRTGDLGFIKDRELFVLGRLKNLIIIRGKNYFPHDLEKCVKKSHPLLAHSQGVVFAQITSTNESLIVLQEIDRSLKDPSIIDGIFKAIKEFLIEEFEISPAAIVFVQPNSLPRTTSGKLQHHIAREYFQKSLLSPLFSWQQDMHSHIEEVDVSSSLAKLLGISHEHISFDEPIISFGMDSLAGMQFLSWIQDRFKVEIDLSFLLNGATVRQIEEAIKKTPSSNIQLQMSSLLEYPLSWNQENIWIFHQLNPKSSAYNILFAFRVKGSINIPAFQEALSLLVSRHAALRTKFERRPSGPVQIVSQFINLPLFIYDMKAFSKEQQDAEIQKYIHDESEYNFDLSKAPLFRIVLLELFEKETILIFHFHHMICDGWSIGIFIRELEEAYQKCIQGYTVSRKPLSSEYNTFVTWQQEFSLSADYGKVENFWKQLLQADEYPTLSISPFLPSKENTGSSSRSVYLEEEIVLKLKIFAAQQKATLSVILMAAFHAILHLYSEEHNIYIGYPAANRPIVDFQQMIGLFVNTLVCKTESNLGTTFLDLIEQVKKGLWQGSKEASYPFQHLLNLLHPPRFAHTSPLFQAMFVMQNAPVDLRQFGTFGIELLKTPQTPALYDLILEVHEKKERIELIFEHQKEKISDSFAEQIEQSYFKFLISAIENPNYPLEMHDLSSIEEQAVSLYQPSKEFNIINLFEQQASKNPQKMAVFSDHGDVTYEELSKATSSVSNQLLNQMINSGEPIGVCLQKEPLLIASLLGILKAGGTYVPIDPGYPADRIQTMVENAQIRFLITREKHWNIFSFFNGKLLDPSIQNINCSNLPSFSPELPAYILHTSGSTGKPKGVIVEQKSLSNFVLTALDFFEMKSSDRSLQFSSINWDTSSEEIYPCLLTGGSLILRSDNYVESFSDLLERTKKYEITIWNLPSSYWHDLVEMMSRKKIPIPPSLRLVIVGGERINRAKVDLWYQEVAPSVKLLNTYGATEATSISATFDLSGWQSEWIDVPIGQPIQNVQLYILNSCLKPVPPGMPGTLYIGGAGVSKGYLNLPELTEEKFILHPRNSDRIYNTGDSAYYTLTGEILLRGRKDRQIKRRGFRVELEEVEKALLKLEQVDSCLVVFDRVMTAYLVTKTATSFISSQAIKAFLRQSLPDYLIPDYILFVLAIPRLPNGKIDFLSLKVTQLLQNENANTNTLTDLEKEVFTIWKSILKVDYISKDDSFFDVGGNSLLLIQLHEKLEETFSVKLNISTLFSYFTITSQAQKIEEIKTNQSKPSQIDLLRQLEKGLITPTQARELLKAKEKVK